MVFVVLQCDRTYYSFSFWRDYVQACRALAAQCGVSMRDLDRAPMAVFERKPTARPMRVTARMKVRDMSRVPGLTEHAHPVTAHDFRHVGGRVAMAYQFRLEVWELTYFREIRDELEIGLLVYHIGWIHE